MNKKMQHHPDVLDVYLMSPETTPFSDAHKDKMRPGVIVELSATRDAIAAVPRTTQRPRRNVKAVASAPDAGAGLTKPGWWLVAKTRYIPSRMFSSAKDMAFIGVLDNNVGKEVLERWKQFGV